MGADGDGGGSTATSDASGSVATAIDGGHSDEPPSELPAPTLQLVAPAIELSPPLPQLPLPTPDLFITAGAIVADRAALAGAKRWKVEQILSRAIDQAGALRGEAA